MRRWLDRAMPAAAAVADEPLLWLPGALAWVVTVGWIPLVAAIWRPSVSGLTYFGSGFFSSGAWPWNAIAIGAAAVALVALAFVLAAMAEAVLIGVLEGQRATASDAAGLLGIAVVAAAPAVMLLLVGATAAVVIAPAEFNSPAGAAAPLWRMLLRVLPILVAAGLAAIGGAALHAAAARHRIGAGGTILDALGGGARRLRRAGWASLVQVIVVTLARMLFLAFAVLLLAVLWAPIGERLGRGGLDAATALLLVGFVAVWLCLVLGGGAVQAWGSATWTRILDQRSTARRMAAPTEARTRT